ncbi:MAG TPA: hypothetical protein VF799_03010 [Geobacteraceae bacterium]
MSIVNDFPEERRTIMLAIPHPILVQYTAILKEQQIVGAQCAAYQKWLRYYLDYCHKYPVPDAKCERIQLFCVKRWGRV